MRTRAPFTGPTTRRLGDVLQGGGWGPASWTTNLDGSSRSLEHQATPLPQSVSLKDVMSEWNNKAT